MGLLRGMAKMAGEAGRMLRTDIDSTQISDETKKRLEDARCAAENGDIEAMNFLAESYYHGEGVRYSPNEACDWWTKAAEAGNALAQYNLGVMYMGNESQFIYNANLAGYWLNCALENGYEDARDLLYNNFKYSRLTNRWKRID